MKRLLHRVLRRRRPPAPAGPPGRPRLLIFDFDGTIGDTFSAGLAILNKLAGEFGFRPLEDKDIDKARDMRTRQLMKFLGIPVARMTLIARRGSQELSARINEIQPLPGMPDALRQLHAAGFTLGILTSNTEANVATFLRNHDLVLFDFVRSSSKLLGKAREIRSLIKARRIAPSDILFIGDETRDIEAAQKARIPIAAVTWGYNSRRSLQAMNPGHLFDTPADLVAHLKAL